MEINKGQKIILFDGDCNLCNNFINFIIDRDDNNVFLFTPLQSSTGVQILKNVDAYSAELDSIVLYDPATQKIKKKSSAAISIISTFGGFWSLMRAFLILPNFINNAVYDLIAKNRYRWFGKSNSCRIPTPELMQKFLD
ncbi:MAG: DCC1-like thiol-disulfide oxidoreductase family protein [Bacteroidota bacterium]